MYMHMPKAQLGMIRPLLLLSRPPIRLIRPMIRLIRLMTRLAQNKTILALNNIKFVQLLLYFPNIPLLLPQYSKYYRISNKNKSSLIINF